MAGVAAGDIVLDVGCGTGLLTAALASVVAAADVAAVDPSGPFAAGTRQRVAASVALKTFRSTTRRVVRPWAVVGRR
jgi:ubiquinone/menaquinone biosynthesis C-methylase UbiE